jgi:Ca-activated chloride channel family protein
MKKIVEHTQKQSLIKRFKASPWWSISIGIHIAFLFVLTFLFSDYIIRKGESVYSVYLNPNTALSTPSEEEQEKVTDLQSVKDLLRDAQTQKLSLGTNDPDDPIIYFPGAQPSDHNETSVRHSIKGAGIYDAMGVGAGAGGGGSGVTGRYGAKFGGMHNLRKVAGCAPARPGPAHGGSKIVNGEEYDATFFKNYGVNPFVDTEDDHFSTFATDVDTASYTVARSYLKNGNLPVNDSVRTEEFVNFFDYGYQSPDNDAFTVYLEAAPAKFGKNCFLQRIGIKGKEISVKDRKDAILTFVIDCSGSMGSYDTRLELVKKTLRLLVDQLREGDRIGITTYQTKGRILMEHKGISKKAEILEAIDSLQAGGSTNAHEGIRLGYEIADKAFQRGCINRLILCTDGVANEGVTNGDEIIKEMKQYVDKGICLSAIGFGMDNYNDVLLEKLGDKGNGHYAYVDTIIEAKRVFVENMTGTLQVIGRDVKVQVDFNPQVVRSYRLLGYENRDVADNKFRDDKEKGGAIGSGFSVTALYEVKLWEDKSGKIATVFIRHKNPDKEEVTEISKEISTSEVKKTFADASDSFKLSAAVAQFAEILRQSYWAKDEKIEDVLDLAQSLIPAYKNDAKVIEFVDMVSKAKELTPKPEIASTEDKKDK